MAGVDKYLIFKDKRVVPYLAQLTIAGVICGMALRENSQEGVIGCMLLSPLAMPIIAAAIAASNRKWDHMLASSVIALVSVGVLWGIGAAIGSHGKEREIPSEMDKRTGKWKLGTWIFAVLIGVLAGLSLVSEKIDIGEMVGVGIAVSLLPPIVNAGILFSYKGKDETSIGDELYVNKSMNSLYIGLINMAAVFIGVMFVLLANFKFPKLRNVFDKHVGKFGAGVQAHPSERYALEPSTSDLKFSEVVVHH